jgi:hypothetical protein
MDADTPFVSIVAFKQRKTTLLNQKLTSLIEAAGNEADQHTARQANLELLALSQVADTPSCFLIEKLAGDLACYVSKIFGSAGFVFINAEKLRRTTYLCAIAGLVSRKVIDDVTSCPSKGLEWLILFLTRKNADLLSLAWGQDVGPLPRLVGLLPEAPPSVATFEALFAFAKRVTDARTFSAVLRRGKLNAESAELLEFIEEPHQVKLLDAFGNAQQYRSFAAAYSTLEPGGVISAEVLTRVSRSSASNLLRKLEWQKPYPAPVISSDWNRSLSHVKNGYALWDFGREMRNCAKNSHQDLTRNLLQMYVYDAGQEKIMFAIKAQPFGGWSLQEAKRAGNERLSADQMNALLALLKAHGIQEKGLSDHLDYLEEEEVGLAGLWDPEDDEEAA